MKILVKFPTRSRGQLFLGVLSKYVSTMMDPEYVHFLISYDHDDETMSDEVIEKAREIAGPENITLIKGVSYNKIHACNRDVNEFEGEWDIIVLGSDDMLPQVNGWDRIIRHEIEKHYPDTDGCLWFYDGRQSKICTFTIMGRAYYNRRKYLYHPSYVSLWCDNEFTDVARGEGKIRFYQTVLFKHEHPAWGGTHKRDALYDKNEGFHKIDQRNYHNRRQKRFPA